MTLTKKQMALSSKAPPAKAAAIAAKATAMKQQVTKLAPWCPSVEIEDVNDEADRQKSNTPHNLRYILELSDGSDDEDPAPKVTVVNDSDNDNSDDDNCDNDDKAPEESAKAKLSMYHYFYSRLNWLLASQNAYQKTGMHQFMSFSGRCLKLSMWRIAKPTYLNVLWENVGERMGMMFIDS